MKNILLTLSVILTAQCFGMARPYNAQEIEYSDAFENVKVKKVFTNELRRAQVKKAIKRTVPGCSGSALPDDCSITDLVNTRFNGEKTALHWAAICGDVESARVLIDNGAYVDLQDIYGDTALHRAARSAFNEEIITLLFANGNSFDETNAFGHTPLDAARISGNTQPVMLLAGLNLARIKEEVIKRQQRFRCLMTLEELYRL